MTAEEHPQLAAECRASNAFSTRRAQIILASSRGLSPKPIAQLVGSAVRTVRHVIHVFHTKGLACIAKQSTRPKSVAPALGVANGEWLQQILHQAPRTYGKSTGRWTLVLAAQVRHEQGVTTRCMRQDAILRVLQHLRTNWQRAKCWITSPDPRYARKKWRDRLIGLAVLHPEGVLGVQDEVWWSRLAQPNLYAWTYGTPLRLIQNKPDRRDSEPKAVPCYGL